MPQFNKTPLGNNPDGKAPGSKAIARDRKGRRTAIIVASVVIVLILIIVGVSLYINAAPFRRIIITVDDTSINMDYFLMRTRLADGDPMAMIQQLTNEQLIKIEAPRYVAEVTPEDIDQELRRIASGESETISEDEFKEWYRQVLNENDFSDSEYKEIVATSLLAARLQVYLGERMSTVAEQVHLHAILLGTNEDAEKIRARWEAGEDFADLAREVSLDKVSGEEGGDLGWLPRGILPPGFDEVVFDDLIIDDVSEPLAYISDYQSEEMFYYLLMVSEKADAREIDEEPLQILKAQVLDDWLSAEIKFHEVEWDFNSEIYAWMNWQLAKE
jgi:foldase protein PrsA